MARAWRNRRQERVDDTCRVKSTVQSAAPERLLLDMQMRAQSYASRSPLASTQAEINATFEKEWDRMLLTTLGVAGKRVYELRLQSPITSFEQNAVSWHWNRVMA